MRDVEKLQAKLGYRFKDPALLDRALTHRSYSYEFGAGSADHYETLEFLGDALLGFLVSELLWRDDPAATEGLLTRRKQLVVRTGTLAAASRRLGLGDALLLGRGEKITGGREKISILADAFEAVLGAIYLDGGIRPARAFVRRHLRSDLRDARAAAEVGEDYKTRLQERVQARLRITPTYRIVSTSGPDHARTFEVEVRLQGRVLGSGSGSSRKQAEQAAARQALEDDPSGVEG